MDEYYCQAGGGLYQGRQLIFVYGTLRLGEENHPLLAASRMLGKAVTAMVFTMIELEGYPAVIHCGRSAIVGEVYEIAMDTFAKLDKLEEYPDYYQRIIIPTPYGDAWMYVLSEMPETCISLIPSGDWLEHKARKQAEWSG